MVPGRVEIAGIALSKGEATLRPLPSIEVSISEISTQTAGKLFVALKGLVAGEIVLGLSVDGSPVEVMQNEKQMGTHVEITPPGRFEAYDIDLPMRIIGPEDQQFPATHSITVFWGNLETITNGWQGVETCKLVVTGKAPKVKYNPVTDSD